MGGKSYPEREQYHPGPCLGLDGKGNVGSASIRLCRHQVTSHSTLSSSPSSHDGLGPLKL